MLATVSCLKVNTNTTTKHKKGQKWHLFCNLLTLMSFKACVTFFLQMVLLSSMEENHTGLERYKGE